MTRYARGKGSKASNEKLPNEATPWHVMKQQMEENQNKEPLEKKKGAKELLKDQESKFDYSTNENIDHGWAEFEDTSSKVNIKKRKNSKSKKNCTDLTLTSQNDDTIVPKSSDNIERLQEIEDKNIKATDSKTSKFSGKKKQATKNSHSSASEEKASIPSDETNSNFNTMSKRQKRNLKRKLKVSNNESKRFKQDESGESALNKVKEKTDSNLKIKKEYKRRKPDVGVIKIIINGMETEIVKYDGFPVKKEDAERLTELKQKLIMKGIPKSEVDIAMKLERRKAEKALARIKKQVCFNCRKSGHNLSDCPELDHNETSTGICFKCGSTEHTHFECKVNKESTYRYANCFICREQGHIAMQCPDNPKGIYPHGGSCKVCGAVTHLKKDCPDLVEAKEGNAITVEKLDNSAVESLHEDVKETSMNNQPSKNKIIKF